MWIVGPISSIPPSEDRLTNLLKQLLWKLGLESQDSLPRGQEDKCKERRRQELVYAQFHIWQTTRNCTMKRSRIYYLDELIGLMATMSAQDVSPGTTLGLHFQSIKCCEANVMRQRIHPSFQRLQDSIHMGLIYAANFGFDVGDNLDCSSFATASMNSSVLT